MPGPRRSLLSRSQAAERLGLSEDQFIPLAEKIGLKPEMKLWNKVSHANDRTRWAPKVVDTFKDHPEVVAARTRRRPAKKG